MDANVQRARRHSKPRAMWTSEDHREEIALCARRAYRDPRTRLVWCRVTRNAPPEVVAKKDERIRQNIAYFFRFGLTLRRLVSVLQATRRDDARSELRELGIVGASGRISTNLYLRETRARLRGPGGLLSRTGIFRSISPILEAIVVHDPQTILSMLTENLARAKRAPPRIAAVQMDGWHPHVWTRIRDGADAIRSRSAVQLSLWMPPSQEFWTSAVLAVAVSHPESLDVVLHLLIQSRVSRALREAGLVFYFLVDGGLRKKIFGKAACRCCGRTLAEVQLLASTREAVLDKEYMSVQSHLLPPSLPPWHVVTEWLHTLALWMFRFLGHHMTCPLMKSFVTCTVKTSISTLNHSGGAAQSTQNRGKGEASSLAIHDLTRLCRHPWSTSLSAVLPESSRETFQLLVVLRNDLRQVSASTLRERLTDLHRGFKRLGVRITMGMHEIAHIPNLMEELDVSLLHFVGQGLERVNQRLNVALAMASGHVPTAVAYENGRVLAVSQGILPLEIEPSELPASDLSIIHEIPADLTEAERSALDVLRVSPGAAPSTAGGSGEPSYITTYRLDGGHAHSPAHSISLQDIVLCTCVIHAPPTVS